MSESYNQSQKGKEQPPKYSGSNEALRARFEALKDDQAMSPEAREKIEQKLKELDTLTKKIQKREQANLPKPIVSISKPIPLTDAEEIGFEDVNTPAVTTTLSAPQEQAALSSRPQLASENEPAAPTSNPEFARDRSETIADATQTETKTTDSQPTHNPEERLQAMAAGTDPEMNAGFDAISKDLDAQLEGYLNKSATNKSTKESRPEKSSAQRVQEARAEYLKKYQENFGGKGLKKSMVRNVLKAVRAVGFIKSNSEHFMDAETKALKRAYENEQNNVIKEKFDRLRARGMSEEEISKIMQRFHGINQTLEKLEEENNIVGAARAEVLGKNEKLKAAFEKTTGWYTRMSPNKKRILSTTIAVGFGMFTGGVGSAAPIIASKLLRATAGTGAAYIANLVGEKVWSTGKDITRYQKQLAAKKITEEQYNQKIADAQGRYQKDMEELKRKYMANEISPSEYQSSKEWFQQRERLINTAKTAVVAAAGFGAGIGAQSGIDLAYNAMPETPAVPTTPSKPDFVIEANWNDGINPDDVPTKPNVPETDTLQTSQPEIGGAENSSVEKPDTTTPEKPTTGTSEKPATNTSSRPSTATGAAFGGVPRDIQFDAGDEHFDKLSLNQKPPVEQPFNSGGVPRDIQFDVPDEAQNAASLNTPTPPETSATLDIQNQPSTPTTEGTFGSDENFDRLSLSSDEVTPEEVRAMMDSEEQLTQGGQTAPTPAFEPETAQSVPLTSGSIDATLPPEAPTIETPIEPSAPATETVESAPTTEEIPTTSTESEIETNYTESATESLTPAQQTYNRVLQQYFTGKPGYSIERLWTPTVQNTSAEQFLNANPSAINEEYQRFQLQLKEMATTLNVDYSNKTIEQTLREVSEKLNSPSR